MTQTKHKTNISARAAYENAALVAADQLTRIHEILEDRAKLMLRDGPHINWGHVGDLTKLNADLSDIIRFMGAAK